MWSSVYEKKGCLRRAHVLYGGAQQPRAAAVLGFFRGVNPQVMNRSAGKRNVFCAFLSLQGACGGRL
ncbi:MAG: hypothetical protein EAY75_02980 [Bacteroidetes bacterium]|nr:MAG: hypothetical protein EAY75_02980 [Bacteroidota bacterium]